MLIDNDGVVAKQLSDFDMNKVVFIDKFDINLGFISIGKESIRFWKIKKDLEIFSGTSLSIGKNALGVVFTDIAIIDLDGNYSPKALISANNGRNFLLFFYIKMKFLMIIFLKGNLFIIDVNSKEIIAVYNLHDCAIKSISCDLGNHLISTCDEKAVIKIWNTDFNDIIYEAKIESQAISLYFKKNNTVINKFQFFFYFSFFFIYLKN